MARLRTLLIQEEVRLLTLTGPGGSGKTRLALAVAETWEKDFPGSVVFVSLATLRDSESVQQIITQAAEATTVTALPPNGYHLLLCDNFEHVLEVAPLLGQLLAQDPHLKILVTSRVVLHIYGEHEYAVQPLTVPTPQHVQTIQALRQVPAVRLFVQRAQAVRPDFRLTEENASAVAAICLHMDGLPLALELAAARVKTFSPVILLARLGERFTLLTTGPRNVLARQQTLRDAIEWSYNLLEPPEQRLFARLAVFVGSFALDAAQAICSEEDDQAPDLLDRLSGFVDQSLLRQGEGVKGELRFGMLETIREYAWMRLGEAGEADLLQHRLADYYLNLLEPLCLQPLNLDIEVNWFSLENANLHAVYSWAVSHNHLDIVERLGLVLWQLGMGSQLEAGSALGWETVL